MDWKPIIFMDEIACQFCDMEQINQEFDRFRESMRSGLSAVKASYAQACKV
jgi:hypothetical protein